MAEALKLANDIWYWMQKEHPTLADLEGCYPAIVAVIISLTEPDSPFYKRLKEFVEEE